MLWRVFIHFWSLLALVSRVQSEGRDLENGGTELRLSKVHLPIAPKVSAPPRPAITPTAKSETTNAVYRDVDSGGTKSSPLATCKYSCPPHDGKGAPLAHKATAFGWDFDGYTLDKGKGRTRGQGWYDIFECIYGLPSLISNEHTCSYYKNDGTHALGYPRDNCPAQAPPCAPTTPSASPATPSPANSALQNVSDSTHTNESSQSGDSETSPNIDGVGANDTHPTGSPLFSSSQLAGAVLIDSVKGIYNYTDTEDVTPQWVEGGRDLLWLKEHPPAELI